MPRKNGFECLSAIKEHTALNHLPVIMYSTSLEQETVNQLFKNGALYFIRKPSDFAKFTEVIRRALRLVTHGNLSQPAIEDFILAV